MKICFPIENNEGLESTVYGHFGSAPMFVLVDTDKQSVESIHNRDLHHEHGSCSPLKAIDGHSVDAIIVGGIGKGALMGLKRANIKVYRCQGVTIADSLAAISVGDITELTPDQACGGHDHSHSCSH